MDFDMELVNLKVGGIVRNSVESTTALSKLLSFCRESCPSFPNVFNKIDIISEVKTISDQLSAVFAQEPIPPKVTVLYFGLFEALNENDSKSYAGYYVSGVDIYNSDDLDTLCDPIYFPERRYLRSSILDQVIDVAMKEEEVGNFIFYSLMLGIGTILSRYALEFLNKKYKLVVGFDDGDIIEI
ncbi:MAG: hypothetical protein WC455_08540 [Dehalococcoidia bacterium]